MEKLVNQFDIIKKLSDPKNLVNSVQGTEPLQAINKDFNRNIVFAKTSTEKQLIEICCQLFKKNIENITSNFFELGGTSLLAVQLASRIRKTLNIEIPFTTISKKPVLKDLAETLDSLAGQTEILPCIHKNSDHTALSFFQQRLWFLEQLMPGLSMYHISHIFKLKGRLNIKALEQALKLIVSRHEILRTKIRSLEGKPIQEIIEESFKLERRAVKENLLLNEAVKEIERPFNFETDTLFRAVLLDIDEETYGFVLVFHHIIFDGWSMGIFGRELQTIYKAISANQTYQLEPLKIQYADFSAWQKAWLKEKGLAKQLSYWTNKLSNVTTLELPSKPRPDEQSYQGKIHHQVFDSSMVDRLNAFAKQRNVTLFMVLLASFKGVISRLSGQYDIVVGSPIANRRMEEIENLIGFFVNTLVLRTDCSGNPNFENLLARVETTCLEAYENQDAPFEQIVDALNLTRDLGRHPLFQVAFALHNEETISITLDQVEVNYLTSPDRQARFDLSLNIYESKQGLHVEYEYVSDLFEDIFITRLSEYYWRFINAILKHPDLQLSEVPILSEQKLKKVLPAKDRLSGYVGDYHGKSINELFEAQVNRTPNAIALIYNNNRMTYQELNEKANRVAHYLKDIGIGPEKIVTILLDRTPEFLICMLAIFKSGAAYVALNPETPLARNQAILNKTESAWVFTREEYKGCLAGLKHVTHVLDIEEILAQNYPKNNLCLKIAPDSLAYLFFTSGSTGEPKGAMIEHEGMINHIMAKINNLSMSNQDITAQTSVQTFDVSLWQFICNLLVGGKVVIFPGESAWEPQALLDLMKKEKVTIFETVPAHMNVILDEIESTRRYHLASLNWLILNGEAIPNKIYNRWLKAYPTITMITTYGATECSDDISHYKIPKMIHPEEGFLPISGLLDNLTIYVLDEYLSPVPIGTIGEIYIGGIGVGRGYLKEPERTKKAFLVDPFSHIPNAKIYKTGDLGKWLDNGLIEAVGRMDHQIKIRGFRVELGEIESVLQAVEGVKECVLLMREDISNQKKLVAYITSDIDEKTVILNCKEQCKNKLPEYMQPNHFLLLKQMPLNQNGKIDRKALPRPDDRDGLDFFDPPKTDFEMAVSKSWSSTLGITQVGRGDNFFLLGGNSLTAIQMISQIRKTLNVEVPVKLIFKYPILKEFSLAIEKNKDTSFVLPPIKRMNQSIVPISFSQQRLWFMEQLLPEMSLYHIPVCFKITGQLNIDALQKALQDIVKRHEVLRCKIIVKDGIAYQELIQTELEVKSKYVPEALFMNAITSEIKEPFNFDKGPLFRCCLIRLNEKTHALLIIFHHIIFDGWSTGILIQELNSLYNSYEKKQISNLPELSVQYSDFTLWQKAWLKGDVLSNQLLYWKRKLHRAPYLSLTSKTRPKRPSYQGKLFSQVMSKPLLDQLDQFSKRENVTLFVALLSAFNATLYKLSNQTDVVIGTSIANRRTEETEKMIGFFINAIVLRTDCSGNPSFEELVRRTERVTIEAYESQDVPFAQVVDYLNIPRDLSKHPLFQINFVLQNTREAILELADLDIKLIKEPERIAKFDITLSMNETEQGLYIDYEYATDLFESEYIETLALTFEKMIQSMINQPQLRINGIDFSAVEGKEQQEQPIYEC